MEDNHCLVQYSPFDLRNYFSILAMPLKMPHCWKSHVTAQMVIHGPRREKTYLRGLGQQRRSPACASAQSDQRIYFRFLESIISKLATSDISTFYLVSVTEETGLKLALSATPKTGFVATRPKYNILKIDKWASTGEKLSAGGGEQQKRRPANKISVCMRKCVCGWGML